MQDIFPPKNRKTFLNILIIIIILGLILIIFLKVRINYFKTEIEFFKIISYMYPLTLEDLINKFGKENVIKFKGDKIALNSILSQCPSEMKSKLGKDISLYEVHFNKFLENPKYNKWFKIPYIYQNWLIIICNSENKIIGYYFYRT